MLEVKEVCGLFEVGECCWVGYLQLVEFMLVGNLKFYYFYELWVMLLQDLEQVDDFVVQIVCYFELGFEVLVQEDIVYVDKGFGIGLMVQCFDMLDDVVMQLFFVV